MDSNHPVGVFVAKLRGDERTPIAALRGKLVVAEHFLHQLDPEVGGAPVVDPGGGQRGRETVAGKGRHHHVEGVFGRASERGGVGQRADYLMQIPERPRPSVTQDQRDGMRSLARLVDEMDWDAFYSSLIMREAV